MRGDQLGPGQQSETFGLLDQGVLDPDILCNFD